MKQYQYKMQWLLSKPESIKVIKLFGAGSLTSIHIRDIEMKIIHSFMNPSLNNPAKVNKEVIGWIELMFKKDQSCLYVEIYRK